MSIIDKIPDYRKQIGPTLWEHLEEPELPTSLRLKQIPCNFDSTLYLQPFLSIISSLSIHLKEGEEDTMLGLVFGLLAMYGTIATKYLLEDVRNGKQATILPTYGKMGYQLYKKILWVNRTIQKSRMEKGIAFQWSTPVRFQKRNPMHEFTPESWDYFMCKMKHAIQLTRRALENVEQESKKECDKLKAREYQKLYKLLNKIPRVGPLNANHLLGLMALCGVIPVILFEEEVGGATKGYERLDEKHFLQKKNISHEEVKEKLGNALKQRLGTKPTKRKVENILCKVRRRMKNNSDRLYVDLVDTMFPLVTYENGKVIFQTEKKVLFESEKGMMGNIPKLKKFQHSLNENDKWMKKLK